MLDKPTPRTIINAVMESDAFPTDDEKAASWIPSGRDKPTPGTCGSVKQGCLIPRADLPASRFHSSLLWTMGLQSIEIRSLIRGMVSHHLQRL
jgi:hypothetical protein